MHDLHEADKIIKLVIENAAKNNLTKITKINLELGKVIEHGSEINPENLIFNLKMLSQNTPAANAEIVIQRSTEPYWKLIDIEGE